MHRCILSLNKMADGHKEEGKNKKELLSPFQKAMSNWHKTFLGYSKVPHKGSP